MIRHTRYLDQARAALGAAFEPAFAAGRALTDDGVADLALSDGAARSDDPLTPREAEIARLVAQGMTNRDIASRLVISPRTADTHVGNILKKLGFTTRVQLVAWVAAR
ncbi:LuxR C-terminal-related transcriptional regulator [Actinokineospora soli]|uniref:LuxR C-terminal-related transcriptional regulator n=1 Tax=Actinokineospora soli TaxID=1048753 RepID=A0ABW2TL86_9PSEU